MHFGRYQVYDGINGWEEKRQISPRTTLTFSPFIRVRGIGAGFALDLLLSCFSSLSFLLRALSVSSSSRTPSRFNIERHSHLNRCTLDERDIDNVSSLEESYYVP